MRARQQETNYGMDSAAARTGLRRRRQEILQNVISNGRSSKAIEQKHKRHTDRRNAARERRRGAAAARSVTPNTKPTLPSFAMSRNPTLRINDYDDDMML
jgi:hypothetical protein